MLQGLPLFLLCAHCWLQCHDLYVSFEFCINSLLSLNSGTNWTSCLLFQTFGTCCPKPSCFLWQKGPSEKANWPFCEWRTSKCEWWIRVIMNVDLIHLFLSLVFNVWKIQLMFNLCPLKSSTYYFLRVIKCSRANIWLGAAPFIC